MECDVCGEREATFCVIDMNVMRSVHTDGHPFFACERCRLNDPQTWEPREGEKWGLKASPWPVWDKAIALKVLHELLNV